MANLSRVAAVIPNVINVSTRHGRPIRLSEIGNNRGIDFKEANKNAMRATRLDGDADDDCCA